MKRLVKILIVWIGIFSIAISVQVFAASAKMNLSSSNITVTVGTSKTVKATVTGTNKKVKWRSSNTSIVTVNSKGKVTGKKAGTATITASVNGVKKTCKVKVTKPAIKLNKKSASIQAGKTLTLKATVRGATKKVNWTSSNKKVASVSAKGVVTAHKKGTAIITAKANGVKAQCKIQVKAITKTYSEDELYNIISRNNSIADCVYADFDGNGTKEMFATSVMDGSDIKAVYFISSTGKVTQMASYKTRDLGVYTLLSKGRHYYSTGGKGFYFVDYNWTGTTWGDCTLLFSVKNGKPYELKLSGSLSGFYTDNGVYTIRHLLRDHHVYMRTRLIYDSSTQEFKFGKDIGEWW